jgi:hypothetical protein
VIDQCRVQLHDQPDNFVRSAKGLIFSNFFIGRGLQIFRLMEVPEDVETIVMANVDNGHTAAALMNILGEDLASLVMSHLNEDEVSAISSATVTSGEDPDETIDRLEQLLSANQM